MKPGDKVDMDHLLSPAPGLIVQMSGFLTRDRYNCATIFVDRASTFMFIQVKLSTGAEETVQAKNDFERHARENGIDIIAYHSDNGTFVSQ